MRVVFRKTPLILTRCIAIEFEIEPADSKIADIYCTVLPFVEKEILYTASLGNKIEAEIEKAIG